MQGAHDSRTRSTLLRRLRDLSDRDAWNEFLDRYAPRIFAWCRRFKLQDADAADVTQDVLGKLVLAMRSFEYDPNRGSFRAWLKTVTNNTLRDLAATWSRPDRATGDSRAGRDLEAHKAPEALAALAVEIEAEAERELLHRAQERVQLRVQPRTWQAYLLTALEGQSAAVVAPKVGLSVAEVYVAKSRVIKLLRQEVDKLLRHE
jgi:RNA polymerase sigma-70 factor (ECF subfamily)